MMRERAEDAKRREVERVREENRKRSQEQRAVIEVRRDETDAPRSTDVVANKSGKYTVAYANLGLAGATAV